MKKLKILFFQLIYLIKSSYRTPDFFTIVSSWMNLMKNSTQEKLKKDKKILIEILNELGCLNFEKII